MTVAGFLISIAMLICIGIAGYALIWFVIFMYKYTQLTPGQRLAFKNAVRDGDEDLAKIIIGV
jgi:hypothetical protein